MSKLKEAAELELFTQHYKTELEPHGTFNEPQSCLQVSQTHRGFGWVGRWRITMPERHVTVAWDKRSHFWAWSVKTTQSHGRSVISGGAAWWSDGNTNFHTGLGHMACWPLSRHVSKIHYVSVDWASPNMGTMTKHQQQRALLRRCFYSVGSPAVLRSHSGGTSMGRWRHQGFILVTNCVGG